MTQGNFLPANQQITQTIKGMIQPQAMRKFIPRNRTSGHSRQFNMNGVRHNRVSYSRLNPDLVLQIVEFTYKKGLRVSLTWRAANSTQFVHIILSYRLSRLLIQSSLKFFKFNKFSSTICKISNLPIQMDDPYPKMHNYKPPVKKLQRPLMNEQNLLVLQEKPSDC